MKASSIKKFMRVFTFAFVSTIVVMIALFLIVGSTLYLPTLIPNVSENVRFLLFMVILIFWVVALVMGMMF